MNKNEYNLESKRLDVEKLKYYVKLGTHIITALSWVGAVWLIFKGMEPILKGLDADQIGAVARVFEALNLGSMSGYIWGAVATVAYHIEKKGKKRAITKKAEYQQIVESFDVNRTSSGLSKTGESPREWR